MSAVSLLEAATRYAASLSENARASAQAEVSRFVRWYGATRLTDDLRGHDVSLYGEELGAATAEAHARVTLGEIRYALGDREGAEREIAEAVPSLERTSFLSGLIQGIAERAHLAAVAGHLDAARQDLKEARRRAEVR